MKTRKQKPSVNRLTPGVTLASVVSPRKCRLLSLFVAGSSLGRFLVIETSSITVI